MRTSLLILTILIASKLFAGGDEYKIALPYDSNTQKYTYNKIVEVPAASADSLYKISKKWCKEKYSDDKFKIDENDAELVHSGSFPLLNIYLYASGFKLPFVGTIVYTLSTYFKNGKCKIEISDIRFSDNSSGTAKEVTLEAWHQTYSASKMKANKRLIFDVFTQIDANINKVISDLEKTLKGEQKSKSGW